MKGSCLCGGIEYEVSKLDMPIIFCHCKTCQKAHAAPFAPSAGVLRENFRWIKGEDKLSSFESSPGKVRHFCSACGTHLLAERAHQPHVILRVATLDEDPGSKPEAHIWTSHDEEWMGYEDIPSYKEWQHENLNERRPLLGGSLPGPRFTRPLLAALITYGECTWMRTR